jgi:hypothetical protein
MKTKDIFKELGIAIIIVGIVLTIGIGLITILEGFFGQPTEEPKPIAETRIIEATVEGISVDGTNVLFRGNDGNLWSADSDTKMYRGQQVIIELSSNGTAQIEDDEILNIWLT